MDETLGRSAAALSDLRTSVKWLMAASGATVAAIAAGLQLTSLATLPWWAALIGGVTAAVAVLCALSLLWETAKILTIPRVGAAELSNREINDRGMHTGDVTSVPDDPDLRWIQANRRRLLGTAETVTALLAERSTATEAAPAGGTPETVKIDRRLDALEEELQLRTAQARLDIVMSRLPKGAALFTIALLGFAMTPAVAPPKAPDRAGSQAIQVQVFVVDPTVSSVNAACGTVRSGAIVAGTLERPVVALRPRSTCPAQQLIEPKGVVIVPR